jgi:hypothetical protein
VEISFKASPRISLYSDKSTFRPSSGISLTRIFMELPSLKLPLKIKPRVYKQPVKQVKGNKQDMVSIHSSAVPLPKPILHM